MKIVYNACFGGFGLSDLAIGMLAEKAPDLVDVSDGSVECCQRHDQRLVEVVERLGRRADGPFSRLMIAEVPDGIEYGIIDYDGTETIFEIGHAWGCQA